MLGLLVQLNSLILDSKPKADLCLSAYWPTYDSQDVYKRQVIHSSEYKGFIYFTKPLY